MANKFGELPCPRCAKPIRLEANRCPHCHSDFTPDEVAVRQKAYKRTVGVGCGVLLASVLLIGMCAPDAPKTPEETPAKVSAAKPVGRQTAKAESTPPSASERAQDELLTVLRQASLATGSCDFAIEDTIDLLGTAAENPENLMQAYTKAHLGEPNCRDAVKDLGEIDRLKLATPVLTSNLDFALDECAEAAAMRADGLKTVKIALDGDYSFATAQKFQDAAIESRTKHNLCMGSLKAIGLETGISEKTLDFLEN